MALCRQGILHVFWKVNEDWTGTAFCCDEIGLGNHAGQVRWVAHDIAMFHNRHGDTDDINFLEGVGSHKVRRHLARNKNNRDRI